MTGFSWVHEKCRRAGAGECGSNFVADMTGLTHADNDNSALAGEHDLTSFDELVINLLEQAANGIQLGLNDRGG